MKEITKKHVREIVEQGDFQTLLEMFDEDPSRVRRYITRLAFIRGTRLHTNTLESFKMLSSERAEVMPVFFLEIMRRALWEMNEEGGNIPWSAPEIIASVIAGKPSMFGGYFTYAYEAAREELMFQPSLVAAFDIVQKVEPSLVESFEEDINDLRESLNL